MTDKQLLDRVVSTYRIAYTEPINKINQVTDEFLPKLAELLGLDPEKLIEVWNSFPQRGKELRFNMIKIRKTGSSIL